jgi:hypothetical protein
MHDALVSFAEFGVRCKAIGYFVCVTAICSNILVAESKIRMSIDFADLPRVLQTIGNGFSCLHRAGIKPGLAFGRGRSSGRVSKQRILASDKAQREQTGEQKSREQRILPSNTISISD